MLEKELISWGIEKKIKSFISRYREEVLELINEKEHLSLKDGILQGFKITQAFILMHKEYDAVKDEDIINADFLLESLEELIDKCRKEM